MELRIKMGIAKAMRELQLWFSQEDNLLCAHDFEDHEKHIVLAKRDSGNIWLVVFSGGDFGQRVIEYSAELARTQNAEPINTIHDLYEESGYLIF